MKNAQSLIARLPRGAEAIRALVEEIGDEEARWRLPSGGWSILEIVCHLKDEETDDFRQRLRLTLEDPAKEWPKMDPEAWVTERRYQGEFAFFSFADSGRIKCVFHNGWIFELPREQ